MSLYRDFIKDFGTRSGKVLAEFFQTAEQGDLEVTLMLSVAASGLITPLSRLRKDSVADDMTPEYERAIHSMQQIKNRLVCKSPLWKDGEIDSWRYDHMSVEEARSPMKFFDGRPGMPVEKEFVTDKLLAIIRNALAHGNIHTLGKAKAIETIWFVSEDRGKRDSQAKEKRLDGYHCIRVSPEALRTFLSRWFEQLASIKMPNVVVHEVTNFDQDEEADKAA